MAEPTAPVEPELEGSPYAEHERRRRWRARAAASRGGLRLNLAALIDVVFLLLVYFMLIAEFERPEEAIDAAAPAGVGGPSAFELPAVPIELRVATGPGGLDDPILTTPDSALGAALAEQGAAGRFAALERAAASLRLSPEQRWTVRPDGEARWEHAVAAVNALAAAGYKQVRLDDGGSPR